MRVRSGLLSGKHHVLGGCRFDFVLCPGQEELATTSMFVYKPTVGVFAVPNLRASCVHLN